MALVTIYDDAGNPTVVDNGAPTPGQGQSGQSVDPITGDITFYNADGSVRGTAPGNKRDPAPKIAPNTSQQNVDQLRFYALLNGVDISDPVALEAFAQQWKGETDANPAPGLQDELKRLAENPTTLEGVRARERIVSREGDAANQAEIDKLRQLGLDTDNANNALFDQMGNRISGQQAADLAYIEQSRKLADQLGQAGQSANAFDWASLSDYQRAMGDYNTQNDALFGQLGQTYTALSPQLQSTLQARALQSQAAQAYADPNDVTAQRNAALGLQRIAGGSNDVNFYSLPGISDLYDASQGSQDVNFAGVEGASGLRALANGSGDIQRWDVAGLNQLLDIGNGGSDLDVWDVDGYGQLASASGGGMNINFRDLDGVSDLENAYRGAYDVRVGQEDPEAYAAQKDALAQLKSLTDPRVTDAERFLYEQARQNQERDERANRSAVLTSQRMRGLGGGASELADAAIGGAQVSRNRLLSDLGANAQAINRAQESLAGYANLSSTMSGQANDVAKANANNRLAALGQYTGLSTDVAKNNVNNQLDAIYNRTALSNDINQFNVDTRRGALTSAAGIGSDIARANQSTRAGATGQYAQLGTNVALNNADNRLAALGQYTSLGSANATNNMDRRTTGQIAASNAYSDLRSQGFDEAYKRGTAADQTAQFNELNRVDVQKYNQDYAAKERDAAWNRANDYTNTGLTKNQLNAGNTTNVYNARTKTNDATYGRTKEGITAQDTVNTRDNTLQNNTTDRYINLDTARVGNNNTSFSRNAGLAGLQIGQTNTKTSNELGILGRTGADIAAERARKAAIEAEERAQKQKEKDQTIDIVADYTVPLHILG